MRRSWLAILAVIAVQAAILLAVPGRKLQALSSGTEVVLRTEPVDPYDLLSGYYVTLRYEIERQAEERLGREAPDATVWLVLEPAGEAWRLASVSPHRPDEGTPLAVRARVRRGRVQLDGAGRLFVPEAERRAADEAMRAEGGKALVDLKVDRSGTPALLRLRAGGRSFGG